MFKRDWLNGFAFGIIAGFLLTPALIFAAVFFGASPDDFGQSNGKPDNSEQEGPQDARWWLIRRVVYMDDTAAQWIMMIATIFAAYLLLRTLWATQKMALDTREIGEAQSRAYLTLTAIEVFGSASDGTAYRVKASNSGQSPARSVEMSVRIVLSTGVVEGGADSNDNVLIDTCYSSLIRLSDIAPASKDWLGDFRITHLSQAETEILWDSEDSILRFHVKIDAVDVFGKPITPKTAIFVGSANRIEPNGLGPLVKVPAEPKQN